MRSIIVLIEVGQDLMLIPNICEKLKQLFSNHVLLLMSPSHHPCIDASERESFGCFSHHPMAERTNTNKGITKKISSYNIKRIRC